MSSMTLPSTPRPSSISVCSAREITSRLASSIALGAYRFRKRSPSELTRYAPSPRVPSVISTPVGDSVVGWNCIISMSSRATPARRAGGAERTLGDRPLLRSREDRAPALELVDVAGRLVAEDLDRVLVAQVVRALDRVERVLLRTVVGRVSERRVDAALRGAGVAP